jgi:hypothetical protein
MPELTVGDAQTFTNDRLLASDANVQLMLDAALAMARRDCGWFVCPVTVGDEVVIDGPDSRILNLPTRKLNDLTEVTEDGVTLTLADLSWSAGGPPGLLERPVSVRKRGRGWWSAEYQAVTVTMDHGYTEEEAADWRYAVLSMVDQMAGYVVTGRSDADLVHKRVDDVAYTWANPYTAMAETALFSVRHIFDDYKLPRLEFL